ncbi:addiction module antidote protein [Rhizobium tubonense]|uniref:Putative addiction module antidote protein n=1 Tax=Rhizobium tubonense TaxID=484088 RepID=A0A2W4CSB1_9HYPH|nr:addiction module antidote protein [Rhizobium tubonense]PZM13185.1 putative addiction module antidote protein [Rhizobium tubonense]
MALGTTDDGNGDFSHNGQSFHDYVTAAFETEDARFIAKALGTVARARNMSQLAREIGMNRSALYRALSGEGHPEFSTILKVVKALGLKLTSMPTNESGGQPAA